MYQMYIYSQVFDGKKELTTQLYFENDVPKQFEGHVAPRQSQFPQKQIATKNGRIITFDVILDQNAIFPEYNKSRLWHRYKQS